MSSLLTAEELELPVLSQSELRGSDRYFVGQAAVDEVERRIGRELDAVEEHIVKEEGFVVGKYLDDKNIETAGVGQTKAYFNSDFTDVIDNFENEVRNSIPSYDNQPADVQIALMSAQFRGDLQQSPTFRRLFNEGRYAEAAEEFLDHEEYRERSAAGGDGVTQRLESIANTVRQLDQASPTQDTYTIEPGDTLYEIAAKRGLNAEDLMRMNSIMDATTIQPGQEIVLREKGQPQEEEDDLSRVLEEAYDYGKSKIISLFR